MSVLIIGYLAVIILAIGAAVFFIRRWALRKTFLATLNLKLLLIRLSKKPLPAGATAEEPLKEINVSGQLFSILAGSKIPVAFELAVHNVGEEIHFYAAVPVNAIEFVKRQIQGFWPDAQVELSDDYTIFNSAGAIEAVYLKQKREYFLPVRTYAEAQIDTFLPILSDFSKLQTISEGLAIQVIIKPAPSSVKKAFIAHIINLKKKQEKEPSPEDAENIKLSEQKISKPLFSANYRIIASAPIPLRAREILDGALTSLVQFSAPLRNEFKAIRVKNPKNLIAKFVFRQFDDRETMILGLDELVSIFHLPTSATEVPRITWVKAREAPAPADLPKSGVLIGENIFRGDAKPVRIDDDDRRRHVYIVGQTGTGKSNLLINMAANDIEAGKGVAIIDPHGDLIDYLIGLIPVDRRNDVILFDPGDLLRPIGLNMLEYSPDRPEEKTFIVNEMQSIFNKLFLAETMGPMFEQYMRNALVLLMDDITHPATLMEVPRIFTDADFRQRKLAQATNPAVIDFWTKEAPKAGGEAALANMTPYITSKFNNFIANDYVRPIIGQKKSSFNFRQVMDEGKILLVNLVKGKIGDINANLLGMIVVGKLLMAALSRVDLPEIKRRDFNLYIDEFQNFTTESIATILSEARKYRLNLVIAHQFIAQLSEKIRDAVFGNVGSSIAFRIGADDAEYLDKQFAPVFSKDDLINIDNFNAYVKLLVGGKTTKPFNIRTLPAPVGDEAVKRTIREWSSQTYGRDRQEVETEILTRLRT